MAGHRHQPGPLLQSSRARAARVRLLVGGIADHPQGRGNGSPGSGHPLINRSQPRRPTLWALGKAGLAAATRPAAAGPASGRRPKTRGDRLAGIVHPSAATSCSMRGQRRCIEPAPGRANHYASASSPHKASSTADLSGSTQRQEHPGCRPLLQGAATSGSWGRADCGGAGAQAPCFSLAITRGMAEILACSMPDLRSPPLPIGARWRHQRPPSPTSSTTISQPGLGEAETAA